MKVAIIAEKYIICVYSELNKCVCNVATFISRMNRQRKNFIV